MEREVFGVEFQTNVMTGNALLEFAKGVSGWEKRDCYALLEQYLYGDGSDRVCLIYGLRRTGKTTMLRQAVLNMTEEQRQKAAYLKAKRTDDMASVNRDIKALQEQGFRYVFLDEVTLMKDFVDSAALFSDVYASSGMKLVLSGTDSLGFWLAEKEELYDRAVMLHTTFIPYREFCRLLHRDSIDEYIRYGGTLRAGELDFSTKGIDAEEASFRDDESTRKYIDTAICRNIQHSLSCYEDGGHFRHLRELYDAGELTSAINRVIEDMNHRFVLDVLTSPFKSHDLGLTAQNLRRERDPEKRTDILDSIDVSAVTQRLKEILEIRNREEQRIGITEAHVQEIKEYLTALDLIVNCPIETATGSAEPLEHILITQPGLRYCQAQALVYSLVQDEAFQTFSEREKELAAQRILQEVRGRLLEDIVLLESIKAASPEQKVFKLQFAAGEFDMVVYDKRTDQCAVFEVKHSEKSTPEQYRHLTNAENLSHTEKRFGQIVRRCVLYRGQPLVTAEGVEYVNVEQYLQGLAQGVSFEQGQHFSPSAGISLEDFEDVSEPDPEEEPQEGPDLTM